MTCKYCDPELNFPGRLIKVSPDMEHCANCGRTLNEIKDAFNSWDTYFHAICIAVSSKSPCLSRKIGAILVRDHSIVSTGFNGPSRGIPHCGHERFMRDDSIKALINLDNDGAGKRFFPHPNRLKTECPRRVLGYDSGTHMELCPAQHSEVNAISNAARLGVSTMGSVLYMNSVLPCKNCFGSLINAGIIEIVIEKDTPYDKYTQYLRDNSQIKVRSFDL